MASRRNFQVALFFKAYSACLISVLSVLLAAPAFAEQRIALVVGNSSYQHIPRLENPVNDARLMAATLQSLGFTLVGGAARLDLDRADFDKAVQEFGRSLSGADVGLFYFAGHGVQVRGANYLVPIGANPVRETDVDFQMLDTNLVLRQMEGSGTRLNLVILDACRNNPFGGRGLRSAAAGLATMQAPEGTLISFATQPGNIALDGNGANSPFTRALVDTIRKPGLGLFDAFNAVGLEVKKATGGAQQPWVSSSPIGGRFFFAGQPGGDVAAVAQSSDAVAALQQRLRTLEEELRKREQLKVAVAPTVASPQGAPTSIAPPPVATSPIISIPGLEPPAYPLPLALPSQVSKPTTGENVISESFAARQDACESACNTKPNCRSYRFNSSSRLCTLLNSLDGIRPKPASSATVVIPPPLTTQTYNHTYVDTGPECRNACAKDKRCLSFMFDPPSKLCQFLEGTNPSSFTVVR